MEIVAEPDAVDPDAVAVTITWPGGAEAAAATRPLASTVARDVSDEAQVTALWVVPSAMVTVAASWTADT